MAESNPPNQDASYCPPDVRALTDWNHAAIICRGEDPSGHWANLPRPAGEDLAPRPWPRKGDA